MFEMASASFSFIKFNFGEFDFGALAEDDLMRSIRLFGADVISRLRAFEPF